MRRFQEMFLEAKAEAIEWQGHSVRSIYRRDLTPGCEVEVALEAGRTDPAQGVVLKAGDGSLEWNELGAEGQSIRIWADKTRSARVRYVNPRKASELRVWNVWLEGPEPDAIVQAWWAWSGMLIEESADEVVLRCSGSYDGPSFDDLVVRLRFTG